MERVKFNKHFLGKCYIEFYNKQHIDIDELTLGLKTFYQYKDGRGGIETCEVKRYLLCKGGYFFWTGFEPDPNEGYINCGDNLEYFLALAALRDDTDEIQWLTNDDNTYWERKEYGFLPSKYIQIEGHKATLEEIIEFFKK